MSQDISNRQFWLLFMICPVNQATETMSQLWPGAVPGFPIGGANPVVWGGGVPISNAGPFRRKCMP